MKSLSLAEVNNAVNGTLLSGDDGYIISGVSTDSRSVTGDDIFFAIVGDKFDGHDFIRNVMDRGCSAVVVAREDVVMLESHASFILVDDTLKAYQDLAKYYKDLIAPITIGITGSVGKTSLKDMVGVICDDHYNTVCSDANENNHIGVPKTIFKMEENTEVLVLEMGMNSQGEIHTLADIGRPDIGAITNIGISHIENFADQSGIFAAKMEITDYFKEENTLVVMGDDPYLKTIKDSANYGVLTAGSSEDNDYVAGGAKYLDDEHITFLIEYDKGVERFTLPVAGLYNSTAAALAVAIMSKLDVSVTNCGHSLEKLKMTPHRLQLIKHDGIKIIDDAYNASPASMKSALEYLTVVESIRKIVVIADMKELGSMSSDLHRKIGKAVSSMNIDYVFTVGELGRELGNAAANQMREGRVFSFDDKTACIKKLREVIKAGDCILVKGSHSMEMEKVVEALTDAASNRQVK